ncbi:3-demethylubiquinone-9 3-methyltransferase [Flavobacterium rivuli WB 3.3-2 = DSM 21788]|uniref:3-demethylubiquinone-9 3-methyltransferase n=1 Tax=Flavobacterium rivuli WB 3.3-2 = DSM 21788 TaxID=1121895 RepID=A0A0A2M9X3_9FLAO|nr:VOC family protein [Flavobacterium rivuli]KGO88218.1 3-demethylubiquinone-9 3-methyltransferase [Flavobacterium rivuli WB 3.3-2 = DSM 21788]
MQKVTPCLWFNGHVNEALDLYKNLFSDFKVKEISYYTEAAPGETGSILTVVFEIFGQEFMILNGGPQYKHTEAISFTINCDNQEEVDHYWNGLTANGGEESVCGWLKDPFGISWQVTPTILPKLLKDKDPVKANNVMKAMMEMKKIDISKLKEAYNQ